MACDTSDKKGIIITGAAGGIGAAIVHRSLKDNAVVFACDNDQAALNELKKTAGGSTDLRTCILDVSSSEAIEACFDRIISDYPNVNGLVNNAGIYPGKNILEYTDEQIDTVLSVNIKGAVNFSRAFGGYLLKHKNYGTIVNMSSVSGHEGSSDAIYGLSKSALFGLTKSCAMNFAPYIRVNAVAPGLVETRMLKDIPEWRVKDYRKSELIDSPINPTDIANTVAFLLSDESRNLTGSVIDINNGCYLR